MHKFILPLVFLILSLPAFSIEKKDTTFVGLSEILKFQTIDLEDDSNYTGLSILKEDLDSFDIFMIGEMHTYRKTNSNLQLSTFKYLYYNNSCRILIMEFGPSIAELINSYINSGDSILKEIIDAYSYKEYADYYEKLKDWNMSLAKEDRIQVIGIDIDRERPIASKMLSTFLPNNAPPKKIALSIESLRSLGTYYDIQNRKENESISSFFSYQSNRVSGTRTINAIIDDYLENDSIFADYLGDRFPEFERIIKGLEALNTWQEYESKKMLQAHIFRENFMYEQILAISQTHPNQKLFGQFGRCHVSKSLDDEWCNRYTFKTLANRINTNTDGIYPKGVCNIACIYPKSNYESNSDLQDSLMREIYKLVENDSLNIVKIPNDSPFLKLRTQFRYLVINSTTPSSNVIYEEEEEDSDYWDLQVFNVGISFSQINFSKLGAGFVYNSNLDYLQSYKFSTGSRESQGIYSLFEYEYFPKQKGTFVNGNVAGQSKGSIGGLVSGYEFSKNKHFSLALVSYLGFGNIKLETLFPLTQTGPFGEANNIQYKNNVALIGGEIHAGASFKYFGLQIMGGYRYDYSNPNWKFGNEILSSAPEFRMTYPFVSAMLSLKFDY